MDSNVHREGAHPLYHLCRQDGRLKLTLSTSNRLKPAVLVAGHTATQNSPFLPQRWPKPSPVVIAPTHGGMTRLREPEWHGKYRGGIPTKGGYQSQY